MDASGIVTLLTDFGQCDWYTGVLRGVILTRCRNCTVVDISHEVPPGDVFKGAYMLRSAFQYFPMGTVHLAVVDPGVGGPRRPIAASSCGHFFVGPDNGLLAAAIETGEHVDVREITAKEIFLAPVSRTFHGRDIFAPVAAYLAGGGDLSRLGPEIDDWISLEIPKPLVTGDGVCGVVVYADRFGNGITNIPSKVIDDLAAEGALLEVKVGEELKLGGPRNSYQEVPTGHPLVIMGSSGHLEVSVNGGNAMELLGLQVGKTPVVVSRKAPKR